MLDFRFIEFFIHLLKLAVSNAETAASILRVTAAVAAHPWTSIMGCNRPRRIVGMSRIKYLLPFMTVVANTFSIIGRENEITGSIWCCESRSHDKHTSRPTVTASQRHLTLNDNGDGKGDKYVEVAYIILRAASWRISLFASQLLTRQGQADYQLESGRLDGSLAISDGALPATLAIFGLWRTPLRLSSAIRRQHNAVVEWNCFFSKICLSKNIEEAETHLKAKHHVVILKNVKLKP